MPAMSHTRHNLNNNIQDFLFVQKNNYLFLVMIEKKYVGRFLAWIRVSFTIK